jgi:low temperature requirement protein LtrA
VIATAVLGVAAVTALWWLYFDLTSLVVGHEIESMPPGRARNELARDAYSFLHYPMVAGIVLLALGLKEVVGGPGDALPSYKAAALVGGPALYLVAQVAFTYRGVRTLTVHRLVVAAVLVGVACVGSAVPGWVALVAVVVVLWVTIGFEHRHNSDVRVEVRGRDHEDHRVDDPEQAHEHAPHHDD